MIYVSALPRSGTSYMAKVLQALSLDVGHEHIKSDGIVSWRLMYRPPAGGIRLHQVRHPLRCISSMESILAHNLRDIGRHIGFDVQDPKSLHLRMTAWVEWNLLAMAWAEHTYRIEALPEIFDEFCGWIGLPADTSLPDIPTTTNTRVGKYTPVTWDDLRAVDARLCSVIQGWGERFGYDCE